MALGVVDLLEAVEVDDDQREGPVVPEAASHRHLEEPVEAPAVEQPGQRVVPGVVTEDFHPQRDHAEAAEHFRVYGRGVERRIGVEARLGVQQCFAPRVVEGLACRAEHLAAEPRFVDDHRRVL